MPDTSQAPGAGSFGSLGKILNTVFGWATIMLFGKVLSNRQIYLTIMAFGSVLWLIALVGTVFPSAGTFLISFVPLPSWVDQNLVRLAMLAAVIILPPVVGLVERHLLEETAGVAGEPGGLAAARHEGNGATRSPVDGRVARLAPALALTILLAVAAFAWRSTHSHH